MFLKKTTRAIGEPVRLAFNFLLFMDSTPTFYYISLSGVRLERANTNETHHTRLYARWTEVYMRISDIAIFERLIWKVIGIGSSEIRSVKGQIESPMQFL